MRKRIWLDRIIRAGFGITIGGFIIYHSPTVPGVLFGIVLGVLVYFSFLFD